ncbi:MAG TPA: pyridoxamine 5'-phosphate oxidase family protein [Candidatus Dormibacteraeota bacterium]|nr:pyridoxamine 5'-phosphate oxidase family protein [Candidatus Dormibacteraeota bacterium]
MRASKAPRGLEEIPEAECWELLAQRRLGRIALVIGGKPQIFPVNYGLKGKIIVFRTAAGTKLARAPDSPVAFEIDEYDAAAGAGWSVMVQGLGRDVTEAADDFAWAARGTRVHPAAPGEKLHRIAVDPSAITGRRFRAADRLAR